MDFDKILKLFDPSALLGAAILGAILVAVGIFLSRLLRRLLRTAILYDQSERIDQITLQFLSHLTILTVWILLAIFYAHLVPALHRLGSAMLAGVGLASVVVGFAAQTTLGNLISGISLVLYKSFRRGDRLQVLAPTKDEFEVGTVEDITLGFTILRTDDGRQIIISNGQMAQQTMIKLPPVATAASQDPPSP